MDGALDPGEGSSSKRPGEEAGSSSKRPGEEAGI